MARTGRNRGGAIFGSAIVLVVAFGFVAYATATRRDPVRGGTVLHGRFVSANGLHAGADVSLAGVVIGRVEAITLDPKSQLADVAFRIPRALHLPADTSLGMAAPAMTSANALTITPGHDSHALAEGAVIRHTADPVSLEQQVSDYIFGGGNLGD